MAFEDAPPGGLTIPADLCLIGGGPAGLALASALAGSGRDVLVLESGAEVPDAECDALNEGAVIGDPYAGLRATRHRQLGGTAAIWNTRTAGGAGAKFTPLDPIDFEVRAGVAHSGWPISHDELVPWYERAHAVCGLGPYGYDASARAKSGCESPELSPQVLGRVYHFGARDALLGPMLRVIADASNVRVVTRATAVRLETDGSARAVRRVQVASPGRTWWVAPRRVVLCGGAIENARLLLCSGSGTAALGNASGWVGRGFMEHPRDAGLLLVPTGRSAWRRLRFFDVDPSGSPNVCGRLSLSELVMREERLLNASATLLPRLRNTTHVLRRVGTRVVRRALLDRWIPGGGHGWSAHPVPASAFEGLTVLLNLEQAPHPDNRVVLSRERDANGVPRAELHWRWHEDDENSRQRVRAILADALERSGVGIVRRHPGVLDPNAHHHAGTTRMAAEPRRGVVDAECRVHGVENLYVAGASVFPTAGFANPVLTILALALRLAERLRADG